MTLVLWCVLIAALMPIVCAGIAKSRGVGKRRRDGGFDNNNPRAWLAQQTGWQARANAAQANSFEALPFFMGAVAIAVAAGADLQRLGLLMVAWLVLRICFVGLYLADAANARSVVWTAALAVNVAILFAALK
ncbi:MAPEG family protein [Rivibacter subsaxonicus]|uniref:Putative MAPEG superfamily protein n=1 Tax=Rivibacter subsaxonicus TaxID=457575 RepID=A0A4Q7VN85_9BURK|nr:MAPEG family protein [Rivibacter subsaxonicus]RZT97811.1 putative MAPEG superfamily protein [Rivibacter subsaxonicus]